MVDDLDTLKELLKKLKHATKHTSARRMIDHHLADVAKLRKIAYGTVLTESGEEHCRNEMFELVKKAEVLIDSVLQQNTVFTLNRKRIVKPEVVRERKSELQTMKMRYVEPLAQTDLATSSDPTFDSSVIPLS